MDVTNVIRQFALLIDSELSISWFFITLSLVHIGLFCGFFIKKVHTNKIYKTLVLLALLDVPIMIFVALYVAGLPKA